MRLIGLADIGMDGRQERQVAATGMQRRRGQRKTSAEIVFFVALVADFGVTVGGQRLEAECAGWLLLMLVASGSSVESVGFKGRNIFSLCENLFHINFETLTLHANPLRTPSATSGGSTRTASESRPDRARSCAP